MDVSLARVIAERTALQRQCQYEISAITQSFEPKLKAKQDAITQLEGQRAQILTDVEKDNGRIKHGGLVSMTPKDAALVLVQHRIAYDDAKVESESVDGNLLAALENETDFHEALGLHCVADSTRAVQIFKHIADGKGVPKPRNISAAGTDPNTWSVEQFAQWVSSVPAIAELASTLKQHRFAGDIILHMDVKCVTPLLKLSVKQSPAFRKEMTALRTRALASDSSRDAVSAATASVHTGYMITIIKIICIYEMICQGIQAQPCWSLWIRAPDRKTSILMDELLNGMHDIMNVLLLGLTHQSARILLPYFLCILSL